MARASAARGSSAALALIGVADELSADSVDTYVEKAVALAQDRERRRALRPLLHERVRDSALVDKRVYTRRLENAYVEMWKKWCAANQ